MYDFKAAENTAKLICFSWTIHKDVYVRFIYESIELIQIIVYFIFYNVVVDSLSCGDQMI